MLRHFILFFLFLFSVNIATGQKFLQLEKIHSPKTKKYFPGHEITFQMRGGQWYTRVIDDISYEQNLLLFVNDHVHLDSIIAFRIFDQQRWSRPISNQLFNFAVVWAVYSTIDEAFQRDRFENIGQAFYVPPISSTGVGFLIRNLFKKRTFNLKKNEKGEAKRWRLRVLDLDVKKKKSGY